MRPSPNYFRQLFRIEVTILHLDDSRINFHICAVLQLYYYYVSFCTFAVNCEIANHCVLCIFVLSLLFIHNVPD